MIRGCSEMLMRETLEQGRTIEVEMERALGRCMTKGKREVGLLSVIEAGLRDGKRVSWY